MEEKNNSSKAGCILTDLNHRPGPRQRMVNQARRRRSQLLSLSARLRTGHSPLRGSIGTTQAGRVTKMHHGSACCSLMRFICQKFKALAFIPVTCQEPLQSTYCGMVDRGLFPSPCKPLADPSRRVCHVHSRPLHSLVQHLPLHCNKLHSDCTCWSRSQHRRQHSILRFLALVLYRPRRFSEPLSVILTLTNLSAVNKPLLDARRGSLVLCTGR